MSNQRAGRLVLKVDGVDLTEKYVNRLTYTEAIGELDGMTALINLAKGGMKDLAKKVIPGAKFEVEIYDGKDKPLTALKKEGDIIAVNFEYSGGNKTIILVGVNYLHRLRSEHKTKVWEKMNCKKIVSAIASKASPKLDVDCDAFDFTGTTIFQENETDALFLMRLARENNYICRVVGKKLLFKRRKHSSTTVKIPLNQIQEIRLTANLKDHLNKVIVFWGDHAVEGTTLKKYVGKPSSSNVVTLNSSGKVGYKLGKEKFKIDKTLTIGGYDLPLYDNQTQAKAKADATLEAAAMDFVEGVAKLTLGEPKACCGATLDITGDAAYGWPFVGKFMITKVSHTYSNRELQTELSFKSNSLPKSP